MSEPWPTTLPQQMLIGLTRKQAPNTLQFAVSSGPAKRRRRSTMVTKTCTTDLELTGAELAILEEFFNDTLQGGSLPFTWTDFITGDAAEFRFAAKGNGEVEFPQFRLIVANSDPDLRLYDGVLELEQL